MPQIFGLSQLENAIAARALPTLEQLATNPNRLDNSLNNRFERDDPPPYVPSSESESEEALHHPVLALPREVVLEKFRDLLSKPLNDNETKSLVSRLNRIGVYTPGGRYSEEVSQEHKLLDRFYRSAGINAHGRDLLKGPRGYQRRDVIIRRNIRKRWQRLGIWNTDWGIPGRVNIQPNDNVRTWKGKWQSTADPPPSDPRHPISQAVELRRNLGYGEYAPPPPRSHLRDDSSASETQSFITSRPWFIWEVEKFEFMERQRRVPVEQRGRPNPDEDGQVVKWWKERGHWTPGWKLPHESPSPEPKEDLTPLNTDGLDFTPTEVDALEAIGPNSPPKLPPQRDSPPKWNLFGDGFKPVDASKDASLGAAAQPEDQLLQEVEEQPPSSPPRRRGRPRKRRSQQAELAAAPRRSTRIAARNTKPSPVTAPKETRTRRPRGPPAARNAPSVADAPKKRKGRPRKTQDGGITEPAASSGKKGRSAAVAAAAGAVDGNATETAAAAAAGKRPRGRPRRAGKPG